MSTLTTTGTTTIPDAELMTIGQNFGYDINDIRVMRQSLFDKMDAAGIRYGLAVCKKRGLDPLSGQVSLWQKKDAVTVCVTQGGFAALADRSGNYGGVEAPIYIDAEGREHKYWLWPDTPPMACKVVVLHKDGSRFEAVAYWKERNQVDGLQLEWQIKASPWYKMPAHMLAKCARCDAFRLAFPQQLAGLYDRDEMPVDAPKEAHYQDVTHEPAPQAAPKPSEPMATETQKQVILQIIDELPEGRDDVKTQIAHLPTFTAERAEKAIKYWMAERDKYYASLESQTEDAEPVAEAAEVETPAAKTKAKKATKTEPAAPAVEDIEFDDKPFG